jgi:hypothetical protein
LRLDRGMTGTQLEVESCKAIIETRLGHDWDSVGSCWDSTEPLLGFRWDTTRLRQDSVRIYILGFFVHVKD